MSRNVLKIGVILAIAFLAIFLLNRPVRDFKARIFSKNATSEGEGILGNTSGRNLKVREVQEILRDIGFDPGPIDGEMGPRTRSAIRRFQQRQGLSPTGTVDFKTWTQILQQKKEPELPLESVETASQPETLDVMTKTDVHDEVMSYRLKSKERARKIQMALKKAGFYSGEIDGVIGSQTKQAVMAFQRSHGFFPDGIVGEKTWGALRGYLNEGSGK